MSESTLENDGINPSTGPNIAAGRYITNLRRLYTTGEIGLDGRLKEEDKAFSALVNPACMDEELVIAVRLSNEELMESAGELAVASYGKTKDAIMPPGLNDSHFSSLLGHFGKIACRAIAGESEHIVLDDEPPAEAIAVHLSMAMLVMSLIYSQSGINPSEDLLFDSVKRMSPLDLQRVLSDFSDRPYAGASEVKREVRRSKDPKASLEAKCKLFDKLVKDFSDLPYAGASELKHEVKQSKDPKASLEAKCKLFEKLAHARTTYSDGLVIDLVRKSAADSTVESIESKLKAMEGKAKRIATELGCSLLMAMHLTKCSPSKRRDQLQAVRNWFQLVNPLSLDKPMGSYDSGFTLYNVLCSRDPGASEDEEELSLVQELLGEEDYQQLLAHFDPDDGFVLSENEVSEYLETLQKHLIQD